MVSFSTIIPVVENRAGFFLFLSSLVLVFNTVDGDYVVTVFLSMVTVLVSMVNVLLPMVTLFYPHW